jgi:hypothetical protein
MPRQSGNANSANHKEAVASLGPALQATAAAALANTSISRAESDFTDLLVTSIPENTKAEPASEIEHQAPEVLVEIEPLVLESEIIEGLAVADLDNDKQQPENKVIQQDTSVEEPPAPMFVEPKPKQTGYVPVAPPSFSMPNPPSNTPEFTVHIRPDKSTD